MLFLLYTYYHLYVISLSFLSFFSRPDVLIIDEIATKKEVDAARTHSQQGVVLIGTAHGTSLQQLMKNPDLNSLIGGLQEVTVGDMAASQNRDGRKTKVERRGEPTFTMLLEVLGYEKYRLHLNVAASVDAILGNTSAKQVSTQVRWVDPAHGDSMARLEVIGEGKRNGGFGQNEDWVVQLEALSAQLQHDV